MVPLPQNRTRIATNRNGAPLIATETKSQHEQSARKKGDPKRVAFFFLQMQLLGSVSGVPSRVVAVRLVAVRNTKGERGSG
jgi:hypothetical protein